MQEKPKQNKATVGADSGRMRINRYLAQAGLGARRKTEALVQAGLIRVNGQVVRQLATYVSPNADQVYLGEQRLSIHISPQYWMMHKPPYCLCTRKDTHNRRTIYDLLQKQSQKKDLKTIFSVGRLDYHSTGLLLLTNDGLWAQAVGHPSFGLEKTYHVQLQSPLDASDAHALHTGIRLREGHARLLHLKPLSKQAHYAMTLHIGWNRVLRRMMNALKKQILSLHRVQFGPLQLENLPEGHTRTLSHSEVKHLLKSAKPSH